MLRLTRLKKQAAVVAVVTLWVPVVSFGIGVLWKYSNTPGQPGTPPVDWPVGAPMQQQEGRATLVMFAHPQCPCSRASIGELAIIMAQTRSKLDAHVVFYQPVGEPSNWARTDLWQNASAIPGVHTFEDRAGMITKSFGAFTSGQTLLYDSGGRLLFKGGITASRGHSGDNYGRDAIIGLLDGGTAPKKTLPVFGAVFGCSLRGE
jgi:hypothetical protein